MKGTTIPLIRLHLALFLLSTSLIAFQLEQMQLLALLQWHHFAYFIISVALLGFGAAGTCLALWREPLLRHADRLLPLFLFGYTAMMSLALPSGLNLFRSFDLSLLFVDIRQTGILLAGQTVFLLTFFLGALPLGLVFVQHSSRIGSLYCANLVGSGFGGIGAVCLMYVLMPEELPAWTALLPWAAGLLLLPKNKPWFLVPAGLALTIIVALLFLPPRITPSPYKGINRTLAMPDARLVASRPSPSGLVQLVTAPALRYAPGLSLIFAGAVAPLRAAVFNNGDWFGGILNEYPAYLDASASALPFALSPCRRVLALDAGTGQDVLQALHNGAQEIMAVEPHRQAASIAAQARGTQPDPLADSAACLSFLAPRTWLAMTRGSQYDLITLPEVGSFGGSAGLFALQEQYLLTREGLQEAWQHLSDNGMIRISVWLDTPARSSLRLTATIAEVLEVNGASFQANVAAIRGWDMVTFLIKRSPLTDLEIEQIRGFSQRFQFDPLFLPSLTTIDRSRFHGTPQPDFFSLHDDITRPGLREELYRRYPFNVRPATDNRPFFSQFIRWQSIPQLSRLIGERAMPFLELGYVLVVAGAAQMSLAATVLILLPLMRLGLPGPWGSRFRTCAFFSGLGLGYMFVEIVLIHEMVMFLGHPIFAAATVISSLLVFSGLGSLMSTRIRNIRAGHALAATVVTFLLLLYVAILQPLLDIAISWTNSGRLLFAMFLIAPPAFVMGMPFPLGLERLAGANKTMAAWAWGINGSVSVMSTGLAAIVAVEFGFAAVMFTACVAYALATIAGWKG